MGCPRVWCGPESFRGRPLPRWRPSRRCRFIRSAIGRDSIRLLSHEAAVLPDHPTPHQYLAAAYLYAEQPDKAIPELEAAIRLAPPAAPLQYKLAGALEKTGRGDEAVEHYQAALQLDDNSAQTHNDFAVLLMSRRQDAEARRQLERALQIDPNLANAEANLSLLCAKTGDYEAAIRHGKRALALDPKQLDCYHYIAVALRGEGRFDEAVHELERLLEIDPHYEVARKEIAITRQMQARQRRYAPTGCRRGIQPGALAAFAHFSYPFVRTAPPSDQIPRGAIA